MIFYRDVSGAKLHILALRERAEEETRFQHDDLRYLRFAKISYKESKVNKPSITSFAAFFYIIFFLFGFSQTINLPHRDVSNQ